MQTILFRPFDAGKWFAIGLGAFLAGLLEGGNGFQSSYNGSPKNGSATTSSSTDIRGHVQEFLHSVAGYLPLIIFITVAVIVLVFAFCLLIYWLGSHGQFMFLDNVVRNRALIVWPWHFYAKQAWSLTLFYLALWLFGVLLVLPLVVLIIAVILSAISGETFLPQFAGSNLIGAEILALAFLFAGFLVMVAAWATCLFIFRQFGIPIMFLHGIPASAAFVEALDLAAANPASIMIFILLRIAIYIGVVVISIAICCVTCCIGMLPYIGTVILLPVLVYIKCFTLECLAQFGPRYNVWTAEMGCPPELVAPLNLPPPRG